MSTVLPIIEPGLKVSPRTNVDFDEKLATYGIELGCVVNCRVGESGFAQRRKIVFGNPLRVKSELQYMVHQCPRSRFKRSSPRIMFKSGKQVIIFS